MIAHCRGKLKCVFGTKGKGLMIDIVVRKPW